MLFKYIYIHCEFITTYLINCTMSTLIHIIIVINILFVVLLIPSVGHVSQTMVHPVCNVRDGTTGKNGINNNKQSSTQHAS